MRALASTTSRATCEGCGTVHDVSLPTPGFRCEACIVAESDAAAARTRRRAFGLFGIGLALLALAALMWSTGRDLSFGERNGTPLAVYVGAAGIGCFGIGFGMLRYRPKLKL